MWNVFFGNNFRLINNCLASVVHILLLPIWTGGFPDSSVGKESACNAGDPGSIPGSGRSTGEGTGYPLQYSWVSIVAQLVKNLPTMWETWVQSLGWKDPLEKGKATHSSILAWRIAWLCSLWDRKELDPTEWFSLSFELKKSYFITGSQFIAAT